jgi:hypothetical protein
MAVSSATTEAMESRPETARNRRPDRQAVLQAFPAQPVRTLQNRILQAEAKAADIIASDRSSWATN